MATQAGENHTITLNVSEASRYIEAVAPDIMRPGSLVKFSDSFYVLLQDLDDQNRGSTPMFVTENKLGGLTIEDEYSSGDPIYARVCLPGDEILAWLRRTDTVVEGDLLIPWDGGELALKSTREGLPVAVALEATGGGGSPVRLRVGVL